MPDIVQSYHCGWRADLYFRGTSPGSVIRCSSSHSWVSQAFPLFIIIYFAGLSSGLFLFEIYICWPGWKLVSKPIRKAEHTPSPSPGTGTICLGSWKANYILGCIKRRLSSRSREVLPLCSYEPPPVELHPALGSSPQKRCGSAMETGWKNWKREKKIVCGNEIVHYPSPGRFFFTELK